MPALPPPGLAPGEAIRRAASADAPALLGLLESQPLRAERSAEAFRTLLAIPQTFTYLLERDGRAVAYCCAGKGRDLQGIVHEWAGEPDALAALLAEVSQQLPIQGILAPAGAPAPLRGQSELASFCLARVLRPESVGTPDPVELIGAGERVGRLETYIWGLDSF
jgi:hypothetical protein